MSRRGWLVAFLLGTTPAYASDPTAEVELGSVEDVEQLSLSDLLDKPVTAASGYAEKPSSSPTLVSTLERDTIERFGYRSIRDALQGMRGIYVGNDRTYSYLGSRGFNVPGDYNTRFALSIDNHLVNDSVYAQAPIGLELGLPMIAVERIELVRGGAWSVHGENALLGAVQIVTATGATRPGLHVESLSRMTAETYHDAADRPTRAPHGEDVAASYGAVTHGLDVFVAGAYLHDPGLRALYVPQLAVEGEPCVDLRGALRPCDGVVTGHDGEEVGSAYASLRYKHVTAHLMASRRTKDSAMAAYGTLIGTGMNTADSRAFADVQFDRETAKVDLFGRLSGDLYKYTGRYPFAADPLATDADGIVVRADNTDGGRSYAMSGELRARYKWAALGEHVTNAELAGGVEASRASTTQWNGDHTPEGYQPVFDRTDPVSVMSLFGHGAARAFDRVVGFAAIRADYHADSFGLIVSPQVGVVVEAGPVGRLRMSIARGYRPPTPYERFYTASEAGRPPTDLDPERSETRELSLERYLGDHVRLVLVGFRQKVDDLIAVTEDDDETSLYVNRGGAHSYGIEAELEGRWDRLVLSASWARQHARLDDESEPANAPTSLASLRLLAPIAGGRADVGVESFHIGDRISFDGSPIPALFTTNVVLTVHDVVKSLDASLGVTNLFDERGGDPSSEEHRQSSIPHDPRTVWLRLSVGLDP